MHNLNPSGCFNIPRAQLDAASKNIQFLYLSTLYPDIQKELQKKFQEEIQEELQEEIQEDTIWSSFIFSNTDALEKCLIQIGVHMKQPAFIKQLLKIKFKADAKVIDNLPASLQAARKDPNIDLFDTLTTARSTVIKTLNKRFLDLLKHKQFSKIAAALARSDINQQVQAIISRGDSLEIFLIGKGISLGNVEFIQMLTEIKSTVYMEHKDRLSCLNKDSVEIPINIYLLMLISSTPYLKIQQKLKETNQWLDFLFSDTDQLKDYLLAVAAFVGEAKFISALIELKVNVNITNENGIPLLFVAAKKYHLKTIEALIKGDVDIQYRNSQGYNAIGVALHNTSERALLTAKTLLEHGVKLPAVETENSNSKVINRLAASLAERTYPAYISLRYSR